ncbi:protein phosphatase 2C domain-containing protein [Dictyobacter formicarum]|uniref:PPM-type phosphatase domain-containing protein n=1 Tax=Dictyobacter formicarum TaxID=2778368 RepID=A0ABQ3V7D6_9CHLR|nr:protein phosphatase 2C domain-containing protein [Dictyobacter formicarum]GHO82052.1 hypothetical protein KSZ_00580 [Dictyobacter formicarum]
MTLCSGGFPPWAWRFLFQVLPQLPVLWQAQGTAILLPLFGLCLLSLALLILWLVIIILLVKVSRHIWNDFTVHQSFEDDLREAELLATQAIQQEADLIEEEPVPVPARRTRTTASLSRTPPSQAAAPQPARTMTRSKTRTIPVPMARQAAYAAAPQAVGDIHFPGLTYPTPVLRQSNQLSAPIAGRRTTDLRQPVRRGPAEQARPTMQQSTTVHQQLRLVPPTELDDLPDTEEDVDIDQSFTELLPKQQRPRVEREQLQLERQTDEDDLDVDLWETRPGDFDEDIDVEQYDTAYGLDDTLPSPSSEPRQQPGTREAHSVGDSFDFDQQRYQPARASRKAPVTADIAATRFVVGIGLDPGLVRKDAPNEDSIFAIQGMRVTNEESKPAGLFMVADGMGGHANGREASRTAIHTISDVIVPALLRDVSGSNAKEEKTLFQDMLKDGVHRANIALYRRNREMPRMMGTTLTAALVVERMAYIANVGDSRTYLYRPSEGLSQITHDHSVVARLVEDGVITRDDIYTHPQRNQIYRCLGEHASVDIDSFAVPLQLNDVLLLCSDGLWEMVRDRALERIIASSAHNPPQLSALLVQAALNHGGADNISVIAVGLVSGEEENTNWML